MISSLISFFFLTKTQEALVKGYTGDAPLAPVEQFLLQMLKIPRVGPRLECIQYKLGLESSLNEVKEAVDSVAKACQALMNDDSFKQLLMVRFFLTLFSNSHFQSRLYFVLEIS